MLYKKIVDDHTRYIMLTAGLSELRSSFAGQVIDRDDPRYENARKLYNGMIDKRPLIIARCADVADVIAAVRFGRENGLLTAVRCGGHNGPGLGSCDDGLVIDLSLLTGIRVDPSLQTVRAEGGCTQGAIDHAAHAFGLAVPAGIVSSTGIGGLTLGGGHGYLTRRYGLTIDNLIEADVVLADGALITANRDSHADLFWALRGGGGNFGVVVNFLFTARPVNMVYGGPIFWQFEDAVRILHWYREFMLRAPVELSAFLHLGTFPSIPPFPEEFWGKKNCAIVLCYTGPSEEAQAMGDAIRHQLPKPLLDLAGPVPFPALQQIFDPLLPEGLQWYWKGDFVKEISDDAIAAHIKHLSASPSELSLMHLYPIDGAVHQVKAADTAWTCRDARWSMVIAAIDPDPAKAVALKTWAREYWAAVHPFNLPGGYINFNMVESDERIRSTYGDNLTRLAAVKKEYDPSNFFRVNQNIKPA